MSSSQDPFRSPEPVTAPSTSGKAIASLLLALGSLVCSIVTALPALILGIMGLGDITRSEGRLSGRGMAITGIVLSLVLPLVQIIGLLFALLIPAIGAARTAARRAQSSNNLRMVSLAALQSESQTGHLPPAVDSSQGAPVSWRVAVLPFLEMTTLYRNYDLSQPWDSEKNRAVSDRYLPIYQSSEDRGTNTNATHYQAVVGPGTAFEVGKSADPNKFGSLSQTILYVEADSSVPWAEPKDHAYNPADPTAGLGALRHGQFIAAMGDGSVRTIATDIDPEALRALMSRDGGDNDKIDGENLDR